MTVESIVGLEAVQRPAQDAEAARLIQQQVTAAQQQAAQEAAQAAQAAAQAGREAAIEGARAAARAQREAQQAIRDAQREMARAGRDSRPMVFQPFPQSGPQIPEGVVIISVAFFVMCAVIAIGFPIARAFARRMDRRGAAVPGGDNDTRARLERIEQAVDAIAIEVERVSEGQRFTTKLMGELRALPQPDAAAGLAERAGDRVAVPLSRAREAR